MTFVNRTNTPILGIAVDITFPETGNGTYGKPFVGEQIPWGATPASIHNGMISGQHPTPLNIPPGGKAELDIGSHYDEFADRIAKKMNKPPSRARVTILLVNFAGDIEWSGDRYFKTGNDLSHQAIRPEEMFESIRRK